MRNVLLVGVLAAISVFSAPIITVIPTLGPDSATSDNFDAWAANVISGLRFGGSPGTGVTQYNPLANGTVLTGSEFLGSGDAGFTSWMGSVIPPAAYYANEFGTVLYFSVKIVDGGGLDTIQLAALSGAATFPGESFTQPIIGQYRATAVGVTAGGSVLDSGQDPATLVRELYYVGLFFAPQVDESIPGSNQAKLDGTAAQIRALSDRTTQVRYMLGTAASTSGNVSIQAVAAIPEPCTWALISAGLVGLAFFRRCN